MLSEMEVWWLTRPWPLHHVVFTSCCLTERDSSRSEQRRSYQLKRLDSSTLWGRYFPLYYNRYYWWSICKWCYKTMATNYRAGKPLNTKWNHAITIFFFRIWDWYCKVVVFLVESSKGKYTINIFFLHFTMILGVISSECKEPRPQRVLRLILRSSERNCLLLIEPNYRSQ